MAGTKDRDRAARIRLLRDRLGLTQRALGELVGVKERTVQVWEAGGNIEWDNLVQLARVAGTQPLWIQNGGSVDPPPADEELTIDAVRRQLFELLETHHSELSDLLVERRRAENAMRSDYKQQLDGTEARLLESITALRGGVDALVTQVEQLVLEVAGLRRELVDPARSGTSGRARKAPPSTGS